MKFLQVSDIQLRRVMTLSSGNSYMWHLICELFTFTQIGDQCVMALDGYSGSCEHKLSNKELNFARVLTVVKKRREYMLQVEFDALTNSGWWRIFAKVEFVGVVSNIVYKGRLQLDL